MHRLPALLAGFFFAIALPTGSAHAAERVALVIGNAKYQHVTALKNPARDAEAMAAALRSAGFAVTVAIDASQDQMRRALRDFGKQAEPADCAMVFFAGHGLEISGVTYLVPIDARIENVSDVEHKTVPLPSVLAAVTPKKLRLVIYDANRDNPFARQLQRDTSPPGGRASIDTGSLDTLILYATKAGQVALEGDGHNSPFTTALLKHLMTPGLDISIAARRVRDEVLASTGRKQEPFTYGSLTGTGFALVPK